jgi:[acyl-carrier-protein] S-malonyltransferase
MGKSLAERFPSARFVFEEADDVLEFKLSALCFEGPEEQLKLTENTQPALVAVSTAAWRVASEHGLAADYVAGHSLGEYSALVAAGAISFADALRLVRQRGRYMQEAVAPGVGAMAAILKLPDGKLDAIFAEASQGEVVSAANYNSPDQIVIAGHAPAVERAMALAKAAGAKRAIALPVSAPFHCKLMKPAQERLRPELDATQFHDLNVPLINNWQARVVRKAEDAREGLYQQIPSPVRWSFSMQLLADRGVDRWFEVGAGAVLTGLLRNILPGVKAIPLGEAKDFEVLHATSA